MVAAIAGCGDRRLVLRVDVLSYLDPAVTQIAFGPIPVVPGGLATGELLILDGYEISLLDGLSGLAEVRSVTLFMSVIAKDSTGSGSDTLRLYASDVDNDPRSQPPVLELPIVLIPGVTDTVDVTVEGGTRVADLFVQRRMRLSLTQSLRGPAAGDPLNGRLQIRSLEAVIVAGREIP